MRTLSQSDGECRDTNATGVEHLERVDKALPFDSKHLRDGHSALLEDDLARLAGPHAELVFLLPGAKPFALRSTINAEIPRLPFARFVTAITTMMSPPAPCVMNCFVPFNTQPSPSFVAVVRIAAASLPDEASVSAQAASFWPEASGVGIAASAPRCRT